MTTHENILMTKICHAMVYTILTTSEPFNDWQTCGNARHTLTPAVGEQPEGSPTSLAPHHEPSQQCSASGGSCE